MNRLLNFCNNCGKSGHIFYTCKHPIVSIGLIAFRVYDNKIQYLMINRKHSLGFVEFMRGKYPINNYEYLINIFNEMTVYERKQISLLTFAELWNYLWGEKIGTQYQGEKKVSNDKYNDLQVGIEVYNKTYNLETILNESNSTWKEPEWGFPKGRRNYQEKDLNCALREFEEETGYVKTNVHLIQNILPYEEIFTGSNMKSYKHKYFVCHIDPNTKPTNEFQETEVSDVKWLSYDDCVKVIRPYNLEKLAILSKLNTVLKQYRLY